MADLRISDGELVARRRRLTDLLGAPAPHAVVLFGPAAAFYLTGFRFITTERPIGVVLSGDGGARATAFVPDLEREHVRATALVDDVLAYPEYPGHVHPMEQLAGLLRDTAGNGAAPRLAVDADGYPGGYGYRGPALSELLPGATITRCGPVIEQMRHVKSAQEIELLRVSSVWADVAHGHLQRACHDGANEHDVSIAAVRATTAGILDQYGESYDPRAGMGGSVHAGFRSQIGANSAFPHAVDKNLTMRTGDVMVTGVTVFVWGYECELERTMFLGDPSREQRRFFDLMLGAQETAFAALAPGRPCSDVDSAVRDFFVRNDVERYWRHHTGHGLGTQIHEGPFLDIGDRTELRPGMVFSIEPGLYVPGLGGFRHSDTAVVTETGARYLTEYPRDLDSLICTP